MTMQTGTQIGPYEIHQLLGQGGMAVVYKVWHSDLHRFEALKTPLSQNYADEFAERFLKESRNAASLHHPHIAAIYNVSAENAAQRYFTMELIEGGDLADLIHQRGRLSLEDTWAILQQVASALDYAHACGVWHRDIKPANILLQKTVNGGYFVKVVDFGISRATEEPGGTRLTKTGMFLGTPEYMSPEQAGSEADVDQRTDQYSLAVIAYEMLCGTPPFKADGDTSMLSVIIKVVRDDPQPPQQLVPMLSVETNDAILKALAKDPADRFDTCGEFLNALVESTALKSPTVIPTVEPPSTPVTEIIPPKEIFYCPRCSKEIADGLAFCPACENIKADVAPTVGGPLPEASKKIIDSSQSRNTLLRNLMLVLAGVGLMTILLGLAFRPQQKPLPKPPAQPHHKNGKSPDPSKEPIPVPTKVTSKILPDGSSYSGGFLSGKPNGHGMRYWPNGAHYSGFFKDGEMNAYGVMLKPDGTRVAGNWRDGKPFDVVTKHFRIQPPAVTNQVKVKPIKIAEKGKTSIITKPAAHVGHSSVGHIKSNYSHHQPAPSSQTGVTKNPHPHKEPSSIPNNQNQDQIENVDITQPNGAHYKGQMKNGAFNGHGVYTSPDGTSFEGQFKNSVPDDKNGKWNIPDSKPVKKIRIR